MFDERWYIDEAARICICNNDVVNCKYVWDDKLKDCFQTNLATGDTLIDIDNCITELSDIISDVTTPFNRTLISSSTVFSNTNKNNNSNDYTPSNDQH